MDADAAGRQRSDLAEAALSVLVPRVLADCARRYGRVPGGALAVVAMGKAGGREMMAGSDLDLMFIYDHPADVTESRGGRSLPASQWFVRAVQACIAALTAPGPEGQMYALDMRLRPSGNKGPIAVSLEGFKRYHAHGRLDLGAHGADPRPRRRRPARPAPPGERGDRGRDRAVRRNRRRSRPMPRRCAPA